MEYEYLIFTIFISLALSLLIFLLSNFLTHKSYDLEKLSSYECGFESFEDSRTKFHVKFYLVAILFIIFDLEIIFLFPWAVSFKYVGIFGYYIMMLFLIILTVGFIYEWSKGALDWE